MREGKMFAEINAKRLFWGGGSLIGNPKRGRDLRVVKLRSHPANQTKERAKTKSS